ncbi:MAG: hypothetical protein ACI86H_002194 [bacterium]|jgi:uncharacterized protein involved in response to NO
MFKIFSAAAHRMFFALGTFQAIFSIIWWVHYQYLIKMKVPYGMEILSPSVHLFSLIFGMFTYFILGFLLTVFPRWLNYPTIPMKRIIVIFQFFLWGNVLFFVGVPYGKLFFILGAIFTFLGFFSVWITLIQGITNNPHPDKTQPAFALSAFTAGTIGALFFVLYCAFPGYPILYRISYGLGIYVYSMMIILAVAYRMLPFFTKNMVVGFELNRLPYSLHSWMAFSILKCILYIFALPQFYWIADGGILVTCIIQFSKWQFFRKKPVMLLSMLYYSMAWLPISNVLFIVYSLCKLFNVEVSAHIEQAALHALTIGCFSSIVLAMATRVTLGHSGRALQTNLFVHLLFWLVQFTALTRVVSGIVSNFNSEFAIHNYHAGYTWIIAFGLWGYKHLPMYFKPRIDGKPG